MLAATKVKTSCSKRKVNKNTYKISSMKRVTRKFLEISIHVVVEQNNSRETFKKSVLHVQSCFLLIKPTGLFWLSSLPSPLSITRLYILFE